MKNKIKLLLSIVSILIFLGLFSCEMYTKAEVDKQIDKIIQPIAWGKINSNGAIITGSGNFTSTRTTIGQYEIRINDFTATTSNVGVNANLYGYIIPYFIIYQVSGGAITFYIMDSAQGQHDDVFSFTAWSN